MIKERKFFFGFFILKVSGYWGMEVIQLNRGIVFFYFKVYEIRISFYRLGGSELSQDEKV